MVPDRRPVLVTGMPRAGTTWLARFLATAQGTSLTGREPMNPGPRQYRLARTLTGWDRLDPPSRRQRRALALAYRGATPWVYGRYGRRQWAAPLPGTRLVVKDPWAMLATATVSEVTGAAPVLVYRHPAAMVVSYRRVGWDPDLEQLRPLVEQHAARTGTDGLRLPGDAALAPHESLAHFWNVLHTIALADVPHLPAGLVVSHEETAGGGVPAGRAVFDALGLTWTADSDAELGREGTQAPTDSRLHHFDRAPASVATAWKGQMAPDEELAVMRICGPVHEQLEHLRLRVLTG